MKKLLFTISVCVLSLCAMPAMATIYHVNINGGDDTNDGLKWSTAFENLQAAIEVAQAGDEIWIAAGTYYPTKKIADVYGSAGNPLTPTGDRHRSFIITKGTKIYGGFPAKTTDATSMSSRNWKINQTILSGDFNDDDGDNFENMEENAHNVIVMFDATPATVLDGLFITGGCANDISTVYIDGNHLYYVTGRDGGGIYAYSPTGGSSPTISNVSFYGNYASAAGGAIFNFSFEGDASPKITNVFILHNKANSRHGGGLFNNGRTVSAILENVNVVGNESSLSGGGLYFISHLECNPQIINTVVSGNFSKDGNGGGIYITTGDGSHGDGTIYGNNAKPRVINSTICGNRVGINENRDGGGFVVLSKGMSMAEILNTVIWGNKGNNIHNYYAEGDMGDANIITGSFIEGFDPGIPNLPGNTDPKFLEPVNADFAPTMDGDYQLTLESPLINKGINAMISLSEDLLENPRISGGTVDIGAYESQGMSPTDNETIFSEKVMWSYSGYLYVRINKSATLRVYSIDGMLVKQVNNLGIGTYEFSMPKGVYIVTLDNGITEKIIVR